MPDGFTEKRDSSFYTVSEGTMYAYSAYYDHRQPTMYRYGVVRVFGLYNTDRLGGRPKVQCKLRYRRPNGAETTQVWTILFTTRIEFDSSSGGSKGVQILSISCSFGENLAKSYVVAPLENWRPHLGEILDPPLSRNRLHL